MQKEQPEKRSNKKKSRAKFRKYCSAQNHGKKRKRKQKHHTVVVKEKREQMGKRKEKGLTITLRMIFSEGFGKSITKCSNH